jgi:DNA-binding FadR family transcriptional regulator
MHPAEIRNPIRRRKLYEEVSLRIEQMLHEGRYSPGDQLPAERELMEEFGVGRSAVREAMLSLQKMGLVTVSSGERARVTTPTANVLVSELSGAARLLLAQEGGIGRFQEARALFEIGLARLAAQKATPEDLAMLREALEANRSAIGDRRRFMQTDVAFHYAIAAIPGNAIFTSLYSAVVEWLTEQRETSGRATNAAEIAYAAHERIYQAIAAGDPAAAQAAMQDHLEQVVKLYWQIKDSPQA